MIFQKKKKNKKQKKKPDPGEDNKRVTVYQR